MVNNLSESIDKFLGEQREEIIQTLFTLCRINSAKSEPTPTAPYGEGCAKALDCALSICESFGMKTQNDDYRCGSALLERGKSELGIVGHLDVVPAGDGWTGEPFEPYIRDGYAIGRGVCDDKNGAVCGMFAARCINELDIPLEHSIRLIFGCAEETGMDDLPHYLKLHEPPAFSLVPDTEFPVCCGEKGIYSGDLYFPVTGELLSFSGGLRGATNIVAGDADATVSCERRELCALPAGITVSWGDGVINVHAVGCPSHASRPEGSVNAIALLAGFLRGEGLVSENTAASLQSLETILDGGYADKTCLAFSDEASGNLTCISGRAISEGGEIRLTLDIRYPVTDTGERVTEALLEFAGENGARYVPDHFDPPYCHDKNGKIVTALMRVYKEITGDQTQPYVMGGGTYARHLPNAAGFGPGFPGETLPFPKGRGGCHEPDECQSIDGLIKSIKIYVLALIELDKVVE